MSKHTIIKIVLPGVLLALFQPAVVTAEENLWLYARGTDTRPAGSTEVKLGTISRVGKRGTSHYRFHDIRAEVEYGITHRLTVGAELMIFDHDYKATACGNEDDDFNLQPYCDTQAGSDGTGTSFDETRIGGFELSAKYNVLSPYKDFMGLSFGGAFERRDRYRLDGARIDQDSYVVTVFTQKNFLDDTLVFALMPKVEWERRRSPGVLEEEFSIDVAAGVSYRFAPRWFGGLEFRHQSDYLSPREDGEYDPSLERSHLPFDLGTQHQAGNYFGPTIHYAVERWWVTAGALYQVAGHGNAKGINNSDNRNWDEHERWHFGLTFGYEFPKAL